MLRIGIADYYLDNWHANEYPGFLRRAIADWGFDARITQAYGMVDAPNGVTSADWCARRNIRLAAGMEALVAEVDAILVIAADDARFHENVCPLPLASGKPVFVDKTFAHDLATAKRMFNLAASSGTPVFSASAQRFCTDIQTYVATRTAPTRFMSTVGPHSLDNYGVHQFEPIVTVMGVGVQRMKAFAVGSAVTLLILDYGDGRMASFTLSPQPWAEFNFMVSDGETGQRLHSTDTEYYPALMKAILDFFIHGMEPVRKEETLEILSLIETARIARMSPDAWIPLIR